MCPPSLSQRWTTCSHTEREREKNDVSYYYFSFFINKVWLNKQCKSLPFFRFDSNGRPIGFFGWRANLPIQFLFCVWFYFEKKKKEENSNRNPFKIRLFVSSCICEYVKPFLDVCNGCCLAGRYITRDDYLFSSRCISFLNVVWIFVQVVFISLLSIEYLESSRIEGVTWVGIKFFINCAWTLSRCEFGQLLAVLYQPVLMACQVVIVTDILHIMNCCCRFPSTIPAVNMRKAITSCGGGMDLIEFVFQNIWGRCVNDLSIFAWLFSTKLTNVHVFILRLHFD